MKDLHSIKVPREIWKKFKAFADQRGMKLHASVGIALEAYMASADKKKS